MFWVLKIIAFLPLSILYPTKIIGKKNICKGKVILVANHKSVMDPVILLNKLWRIQHVMAKAELNKNLFFRFLLKNTNSISVNRDSVDLTTIKLALKALKQNHILTIFPEGTRNKTDLPLLELKSGTSLFALKSSAPIVPVWFKKKPKLFVFNKIYVGEPIYITKENENISNELIYNGLINLYKKIK